MDLISWVPTAALAIALFIGRNWIKAGIEKSIQHEFDEKMEKIRTELRKNEEEFRSELRSKEAEISALRDGVLTGRMNRQALLDKRRIEAVERIWEAVIELAPFKILTETLARIKFDVAAKEAPRDPRMRKLFETFGNMTPDLKNLETPAKYEKPFASPIAWAFFSAYQSVVLDACLKVKLLEIGINDLADYIDNTNLQNLLKTALPHQTDFIEKHESGAYHYLLDELEANLLTELRKMLDGEVIDEKSVAQSAKIMDAVEKVRMDNAKIASARDIEATSSS